MFGVLKKSEERGINRTWTHLEPPSTHKKDVSHLSTVYPIFFQDVYNLFGVFGGSGPQDSWHTALQRANEVCRLPLEHLSLSVSFSGIWIFFNFERQRIYHTGFEVSVSELSNPSKWNKQTTVPIFPNDLFTLHQCQPQINQRQLNYPWHHSTGIVIRMTTNDILLVKIEGPVWYTIYHHLPVVEGGC